MGHTLIALPAATFPVASTGLSSARATEGRAAKRHCRRQQRQALPAEAATSSAQPLGMLLELDGCIIDTGFAGHREAFNRAFKRSGMRSHWSPALYQDLLAASDGSAESMLSTYFGTVGWPWTMPSKEKGRFLQQLHATKRDELRNMVDDAQLPLRQGVDRLVRDAMADGARVGVLAATGSAPGERIAEAAFTVLPSDLAKYTRLFVNGEAIATGEQPVPSLEAEMSDVKAKMKRNDAQAFVRAHRMSTPHAAVGMSMAPGLHVSGSRISASWLQACAMLLGLSTSSVALVAAASSTMQAGRGAGLLTLAVPPPVSNRGRFQYANAKFDGFGAGGGLTWRHVASKIKSRTHLYQQAARPDMRQQ